MPYVEFPNYCFDEDAIRLLDCDKLLTEGAGPNAPAASGLAVKRGIAGMNGGGRKHE
jgi:hypothetical protein